MRLISESMGSFVMRVYEGDASQRQPRLDSSQAALLQDGAADYATSFDLWSDVAASVELCGNGFIWKGRQRRGGAVTELYAFPAENTCVYVTDAGKKVVEASSGGEKYDITRDVIHVRGWSPIAAVSGVSTPTEHRQTIRGSYALEQFRGRYFDSDATPNIVLEHPGMLKPDERADLRASWNARHGGPNGDKTGVLWAGMTARQLNSTLQESQMAELVTADVLQVARMFRIYPPSLLSAAIESPLPPAEVLSDHFWRFTLMPRARRIERALSADREVFPDRSVYARFDASELVRGDIATTASKIHQLTQVGVVTKNEARSELGYPPMDGGDVLQETPVGGAPNQNGQQLALPLNGNGAHAELFPADSTA